MSFEERLLMELKTEIAARAEQPRRWFTPRRLAAGGIAAAVAIAVPIALRPDPAYAITKNADGSVVITIKEFRDADGLEQELGNMGIAADVSYTGVGMRCEDGRFTEADPITYTKEELDSEDPKVKAAMHEREENSANGRVFDLKGGVVIHPDQLAPGQTAVLEVMEYTGAAETPSKPQVVWSVKPVVAVGKIAPCVQVPDPGWDEVGTNPEAVPPPGS